MMRRQQARHQGFDPLLPFGIISMDSSQAPTNPYSYKYGVEDTRQGNMGRDLESTSRGILIGVISALGSALLVAIVLALTYFFRYTTRGRILLDRMGRPGEYDDEQAFAKEEAQALEEMNDIQRAEYMRAKAFVQANPPESAQTDISLSQFLAIQDKGISAWEFEPELEVANCFVEARTEIEFFDSECSVQSNLPVPKQNEVYYWEVKIYDKSESTIIGVGMTTKPYPLFRIPGYHKTSVAYLSPGYRRFNQPFHPTSPYGPAFVRGDVVGVGYRPRTGTVFFTRNGKKLNDVTHSLKTQNLFPTVGATGPCSVHVNLGQMGFVFLEANVKKWGLAPLTGSLAPPPPYGSEQGSILLEGGQSGVQEGQGWFSTPGGGWGAAHARVRSTSMRAARNETASPGPHRSPTDISLAQLSLIDSVEDVQTHDMDAGEGTSNTRAPSSYFDTGHHGRMESESTTRLLDIRQAAALGLEPPPPEYTSPKLGAVESLNHQEENQVDDGSATRQPGNAIRRTRSEQYEANDYRGTQNDERARLLPGSTGRDDDSPPIPSYDVAIGSAPNQR